MVIARRGNHARMTRIALKNRFAWRASARRPKLQNVRKIKIVKMDKNVFRKSAWPLTIVKPERIAVRVSYAKITTALARDSV